MPREIEGVAVVVRAGEPIEKALRRFGKLVARTGLRADAWRGRWYETRSQRRHLKDRQAARRRERAAEEQAHPCRKRAS